MTHNVQNAQFFVLHVYSIGTLIAIFFGGNQKLFGYISDAARILAFKKWGQLGKPPKFWESIAPVFLTAPLRFMTRNIESTRFLPNIMAMDYIIPRECRTRLMNSREEDLNPPAFFPAPLGLFVSGGRGVTEH